MLTGQSRARLEGRLVYQNRRAREWSESQGFEIVEEKIPGTKQADHSFRRTKAEMEADRVYTRQAENHWKALHKKAISILDE